MTLRSTRYVQAALVVLLAAFLLTPNSFAQYQQGTPPPTPGSQSGTASQAQQPTQKETQPAAAAPVPKADPEEEAAYKAFSDTKPEDADKRIQLGEKLAGVQAALAFHRVGNWRMMGEVRGEVYRWIDVNVYPKVYRVDWPR